MRLFYGKLNEVKKMNKKDFNLRLDFEDTPVFKGEKLSFKEVKKAVKTMGQKFGEK